MREDYKQLDEILKYINNESNSTIVVECSKIKEVLSLEHIAAQDYYCKLIYDGYIKASDSNRDEGVKSVVLQDKAISFIIDGGYTEKFEKEDLDYRLKRVTLININTSFTISSISMLIAGLAIIAPIITTKLNSRHPIKTETTIPDLKKISQTQEQIAQSLKSIVDALYNRQIQNYSDSIRTHH